MNDEQTNNSSDNPVSEIELAAWSIVSEPIDAAAIERVKQNAKQLATDAGDVEEDQFPVQLKRPASETSNPKRYSRWLPGGAIAAALAVAVGTALFFSGSDTSAFEAALEKLRAVKAFSFNQLIYTEKQETPIETRTLVTDDGRKRTEVSGIASIMDARGKVRLTLIPDTKTAMTYEPTMTDGPIAGMPGTNELQWLNSLKNFKGEKSTSLGAKKIDGHEVLGTEIEVGGYRMRVWVDKNDEELVQVEHFMGDDNPIEKTVYKDFDFEEIDDSLFSFEVPDGFEIYTPTGIESEIITKSIETPEGNVIAALKGFTKLSDGKFPKSLSKWSDWMGVMTLDGKVNQEIAARLGAMTPFLSSLKSDNHAYLGEGLELNQKDRKIVFWFKTKEKTWKAIFTDLTCSEVKESDLPKADDSK